MIKKERLLERISPTSQSKLERCDLSQGWELSWYPEPILGKWKQHLVGWTVKDSALFGESSGTAEILANIEPDVDHVWESVVCIQSNETLFSVIVCFLEDRNCFYRILMEPGKPIRASYVLYDMAEGEDLFTAQEPIIQSGVDYSVRVKVSSKEVEVFLNNERAGSFSDRRICGRMAGFLVQHGAACIRKVRMSSIDEGKVLFEDDFHSNSLARTVPVDFGDNITERWIPAVVPGTVQTALLEAGVIEDPYFGYNGPKQRWIDRQRWVYRRTFTIPSEWSNKDIEITFHGIDYHGYIWLNGELLGYHEGMHRTCTFPISEKVRRYGENELLVCLLPCPTPPSSNVKPYIFQRWHFNMDILTIGLWQHVELCAYEKVRLFDLQVITKRLESVDAVLDISFTMVSAVELFPSGPCGILWIYAPDSNEIVIELPFSTGYFMGAQRQEFHVRIPNARLWWPNGLGDQPLYRLKIDVWDVIESERSHVPVSDSVVLHFGVRTIEMLPTSEGHWKYNWVFSANGRPFYGKGVNWMPVDQLLRLDKSRYETFLQRALDANINLMRLWGGGLLETDEFYDICDKLGICIWQEFPFANSLFHEMDGNVLRDTVIQNVKRLRNHPSLVMWCCGNEFDANNMWNKLAVDTFEHLCREFDPSREVHRASPYGGDSHSYQVNWCDGANYTYFTRDLSPAITEFSMASPPALYSLKKVIPEEELISWPPVGPDPLETFEIPGWNPGFREHESAFTMHDAHLDKAMTKMMPFISDSGVPENWEEFVEYAQTGQGMLSRFGLDFWRSRWPYCTLSTGWVFNVIWPSSMTWEYVDWFGVPKASYYDYKQAYEALHIGAIFDELFTPQGMNFKAKIFVVNDTMDIYPKAVVNMRLYDISLELLVEKQKTVSIRPDTTCTATFFSWNIPKTTKEQAIFLCIDLLKEESGEVLSRSIYTPRIGNPIIKMPYLKNGPWISDVRNYPTELKLEWKENWQEGESDWMAKVLLTNVGPRPAYRVRLYCPEYDHEMRYSENYIWLEAGESKIITVRLKSHPVEVMFARAWNADEQKLYT